ncbi:hypothetical protein [Lysobacter gummosus]
MQIFAMRRRPRSSGAGGIRCANPKSPLPNPAYQLPFLITVSAMLFGASA